MMKLNSKIISGSVLFSVLGASLLAPTFSAAQTPPTPGSKPAQNFCTQLPTLMTKVTTELTDRLSKLSTNRDEQSKKVTELWGGRDDNRGKDRAQADANRKAYYLKIEARATTDAQKQAVQAFETTVDAAVTARRNAVDAAIKTFRDSILSAVDTRHKSVDTAIEAFKAAIQPALEKAKADCDARIAARTVRLALQASLKTARTKLRADIQAIEKVNVERITLASERKATIDKAVADFKAALTKAETDLKAVLKGTL